MSVLAAVRPVSRLPPVPPRRSRISELGAVTVGFALLYLVTGLVLVRHYDAIMEDALSRVSDARYVLSSRQPKLSAVGFVWTPLPALDFLPFMWLRALWPDLVRLGLLAVVQSAVAMAFAVRTLLRIMVDRGLARGPRLAIVLAFGLQPMIWFYGANGMTEALLLAVVLVAVRRLLRWLRDGDWRHLVVVGLVLAVGYLMRYEVAAVGVAATVLVAGVGLARSPRRRPAVLADAALVALPVLTVFVAWAVLSWIVVGHPFEQLSSEYGNSALVAASRTTAAVVSHHPLFVVTQWAVLAPLLFPVLLVAGVQAVRRRDPALLAPLFLLGAVPLFELLAYISGSLFGFLRYQIAVVPLLAVTLALVLSPSTVPARTGRGRGRSLALLAVALAVLVPSTATSAWAGMTRGDLAQQEYGRLRPIAMSLAGHAAGDSVNGAWRSDRQVADALDRLPLHDGSVLVDSAMGFAVVAATAHPRRFVITSDSDFAAAIADPRAHRISYLLICDRPAVLDAVGRRWSAPLARGAVPWASLAQRFPETTGTGNKWSLWKVDAR